MFFPFKKQKEKIYYDAAIDLSKIPNIISIERLDDITLISFIDENEKWDEFELSCSPKYHQELVDEFKLSLME